jgi:hypothetical protein
MAESKLESEHQVFIVEQLAVFERPKAVQTKLKEFFGLEIALSSIVYYNISNKDLPKKWKTLFNATRKKFLEKTSSIPIANKSFRLQKLQNIFEKQEDEKLQNTVEMRATLEQAAKEVGDVFTNKQKIEEKGEFRHTVVRVPPKDSPEKWLNPSKQ